ncbi:hypothetical protein ACVWW4_003981 [Bradyrhizobium sp. LB7.1]
MTSTGKRLPIGRSLRGYRGWIDTGRAYQSTGEVVFRIRLRDHRENWLNEGGASGKVEIAASKLGVVAESR